MVDVIYPVNASFRALWPPFFPFLVQVDILVLNAKAHAMSVIAGHGGQTFREVSHGQAYTSLSKTSVF